MKHLISLAFIAICFAACKKDDGPPKTIEVSPGIHQRYEITYFKGGDSTVITAVFTEDDSTGRVLNENEITSVTANGETAHYIDHSPTGFVWSFTGLPDVSIILTKGSGQALTNSSQKSQIGDIGFPAISNFSKAAGISFNWTGAALVEGESVQVQLTGKENGIITTLIKTITSGNQVQFSAQELKNFNTGQIEMRLFKQNDMPLDQSDGDAGGAIVMTIRAIQDFNLTN